MKLQDKDTFLYRHVSVDYVTKLDDGTVVWPDDEVYVKATLKQIAYAHPRCETCNYFQPHNDRRFAANCGKMRTIYIHPKDYCCNHTALFNEAASMKDKENKA